MPEFLSFSSHPPFPDPPTAPNQPFPSLKETYDYLELFANPFLADGRIHCNTEVLQVEERPDRQWNVVLQREESETQEVWDAIVICTGWHSTPYWPSTDGLSTLRKTGLAMHAKDWIGVEFHGLHGKVGSPLNFHLASLKFYLRKLLYWEMQPRPTTSQLSLPMKQLRRALSTGVSDAPLSPDFLLFQTKRSKTSNQSRSTLWQTMAKSLPSSPTALLSTTLTWSLPEQDTAPIQISSRFVPPPRLRLLHLVT